jgi:hypothetical protein
VTVVQRVRGTRLRSRVFCKIDKITIWWDATHSESILLSAGGGSETSVCAAGENRKADCQSCKGK